jgi:hypothetical protein
MPGRLQGESGCGGLQVLLTGIEDPSEEQEMQVYRTGAAPPQAKEGHKQIHNGLSYFHLFSEQKWFPLGGTTQTQSFVSGSERECQGSEGGGAR